MLLRIQSLVQLKWNISNYGTKIKVSSLSAQGSYRAGRERQIRGQGISKHGASAMVALRSITNYSIAFRNSPKPTEDCH